MTPLSFDYPISVLILYSDYSVETEPTVMQVYKALKGEGHKVRLFKVNKNNWRLSVRQPGEITINMIEDPGWKLWGNCFRLFERVRRAQFGIDSKSFFYSLSKARIKKRLENFGISTPKYRVIKPRAKVNIRGLEYPLIVKPSGEHSSEGITQDSVVIDESEMKERVTYLRNRFFGDVVVEEYIDGREILVTVLGNGNHQVVLPPCEIVFKGEFADNWDVYTYDAKWKDSSWEYWDAPIICPIKLDNILDKKIEAISKMAFRVLGCRDIARFDIRVDEKGRPYIIDMNLLPDISNYNVTETWRSAQALGWSYPQFVETLVAVSYKRFYGRMPDRLRERELLLQAGA